MRAGGPILMYVAKCATQSGIRRSVYLLPAPQVLKDPGYMEEVKRCTPMKRVGDPDEVAGE
jgi:hypothetical protein